MANLKLLVQNKAVRRVSRVGTDVAVFSDRAFEGVLVIPVAFMRCQQTVLWDRVSAFLAKRLGDLDAFKGVYHRWVDETVEVENGYQRTGSFDDAPGRALIGGRTYEEVPVFPEGQYVISVPAIDPGVIEEMEKRIGDLPGSLPWTYAYEVGEPADAVRLPEGEDSLGETAVAE